MDDLMRQVPRELRETCASLVALTDAFCDEHLDEEYKLLSQEMAAALCQKGSPVTRGKPVSWASGIVHTLGWVNFLSDPTYPPTMTTAQVAEGFGVSPSTMAAKSRIIREALNLVALDPHWCVQSLIEDNPLVWMLEVNGVIVDIRTAPRPAQEEAYRRGLIPYIPANQQGGELDDDGIIARIGPDSGPP